MNCKNPNKQFYSEWICFCASSYINVNSAKEALSKLNNSWVRNSNEIREQSKNMTEEECQDKIFFLEEEASGALEMWRWSV
jgi:hypothetical protein